MGWKLSEAAWDDEHHDLSTNEVHVLAVLAAMSDDATGKVRTVRDGETPFEALCRRTRMSARAARRALQLLADKGIDVRILIAEGKDGRAVYAVRGRSADYRIPEVIRKAAKAATNGHHSGSGKGGKGGQNRPPTDGERRPEMAPKAAENGRPTQPTQPSNQVGYFISPGDGPEDARCVTHHGDPEPPPCLGCKRAREAAEADARQRTKERDEARRAQERFRSAAQARAADKAAVPASQAGDRLAAARAAIRRNQTGDSA